VWICTEAYVGPGVSVGTGAVVAARAVVTSDVPAWSVVAGNPGRVTKTRELLAAE
jgi:putative colanic acid biosynthesis acetyltransferase WcaF